MTPFNITLSPEELAADAEVVAARIQYEEASERLRKAEDALNHQITVVTARREQRSSMRDIKAYIASQTEQRKQMDFVKTKTALTR